VDGELYRQTIDGLLLKSLSKEQAQITVGEVHEGLWHPLVGPKSEMDA
jgi:hypothetical protein